MMEYFIGVGCFLAGLWIGVAISRGSVRIEAAGVKIEARSVREVKEIISAFGKSDPFAKMRGTVQ